MNNNPINRISKFFSEDDFSLHISMGEEYLHGDIGMKVLLFQVDHEKISTDSLYGEVGKNQVKYLPPVEINALVKINAPENKTYKAGLVRYNEPGNLTLSVYIQHLKELNIDIKYGDYIGYSETEDKMRYYSVSNDGRVTSDGLHSMSGYKPFYRTILCVPVQESEFMP